MVSISYQTEKEEVSLSFTWTYFSEHRNNCDCVLKNKGENGQLLKDPFLGRYKLTVC